MSRRGIGSALAKGMSAVVHYLYPLILLSHLFIMWKKVQDLTMVTGGQDTTESIIGPSVHLEGNFTSSGNIVIGGSLAGSLTTTGDVRILEGAKVQATVGATQLFVAGEVRGDMRAGELLELAPTARVYGNVETKVLSVAPQAILHGKCMMKNGGGKLTEEVSRKQKTGRGAKIEEEALIEAET